MMLRSNWSRRWACVGVCVWGCLVGLGAQEALAAYSLKDSQKAELNSLFRHSGSKVEMSFKQTDIKQILSFFSNEFGLNVIASPEVKGDVSFSFSNLTITDAFDSLLMSQGYDWHVDDQVIYVYKQTPIEVIQLNYADADEVYKSLVRIVSTAGIINVNESSNSLIIQAPEGTIKKVRALIDQLDQKPQQVLVEVKILEIEANNSLTNGVGAQFSSARTLGLGNSIAQGVANNSSGLFAEAINGDVSLFLEALQRDTNVDILAKPKILTLNHKESSIITGKRLGYKTTSTSTEGTLVNENVEFLEVGTKLTFTPHISSNGDIIMEIKPEVSEGIIVDNLPQEDTSETTTQVLVKDGQTILISGLIRNKKTRIKKGVPILSSIPLIKYLFTRTDDVEEKKETMVLITPTIMKPAPLGGTSGL